MAWAIKELSAEEIMKIATVHEKKGDALLKVSKKIEASNEYLSAAILFHQVKSGSRTGKEGGLVLQIGPDPTTGGKSSLVHKVESGPRGGEERNLSKIRTMVKESETKNELEKYDKITSEPNQLVRIEMAKKHLSNFLDEMVNKLEINRDQRAEIHRVLIEESMDFEKEYSFRGVDFRTVLANGSFKEELPTLDVTKGNVKLESNYKTHIPNSVMNSVAYRIYSEGEGKISGFAAYKIALEHTRTFMATVLEIGGRIVESEPNKTSWFDIYYDPTREKVDHYTLWSGK